uniref:Putative ovule protein n=1 Tax=Solanum chacoense TaxID=4108 RepID=A0A0V0GPY3_SOLCH
MLKLRYTPVTLRGGHFHVGMLEVSSSKPLASKSKGFAFWVELVALGLPSASYLTCVVCELLHRGGRGVSLVKKNDTAIITSKKVLYL